jgi:tetratricopeptide (TPR) repeat protein
MGRNRPLIARFDWALFALFGLTLLVFALHRIISVDVWWQIRAGEWILQNGFPQVDPFNYVAPDLKWIEMRWLYSVFTYLVFEGLGLNALIVAKIIFLGLTFFLLGRFYQGKHHWVILLGLFLTLAAVHQRFFVRPELVSYLLIVFFLFCLYRYREEGHRRWLYPIPLVQILWVNTHTLFILGPILIWLFALAEWLGPKILGRLWLPEIQKQMTSSQLRPVFGTALAVILVSLVNPYFVEGAIFPLELFSEINSSNAIKPLVSEFLSPFYFASLNLPFIAYLVIAAVSLLGFGLNYRRLSVSSLVIWGAFFYLSLLAVRNVALFGYVAGFMIIQQYGLLAERQPGPEQVWQVSPWIVRVVTGIFILMMVPAIITNLYYRNNDKAFGFGIAIDRFPIRAMEFVQSAGLPRPVLNSFGDGGYLIFEGGEESVFVDGRLEVYGGERIEQSVRLFQNGEGLDQVVSAYNIETILVRHYADQRLMTVLEADDNWEPVYYDSQYAIYLRDEIETAKLVEQLAVDWQNPRQMPELERPDWLPPAWLANIFPSVARNRDKILLGELFLFNGNLDRALAYFDEAIELAPVNETVRFYRGVIFRAKGQEREAAVIFADLDQSYLNQGPVQSFAAAIYDEAGNDRAALAAYQRAIELGHRTENNYRALIRLAQAQQDYPTAISALVELAQFLPEDATIWNELGLIYVEIGDNQRARRAFEQALAIDEGYTAARENLDRLGQQ